MYNYLKGFFYKPKTITIKHDFLQNKPLFVNFNQLSNESNLIQNIDTNISENDIKNLDSTNFNSLYIDEYFVKYNKTELKRNDLVDFLSELKNCKNKNSLEIISMIDFIEDYLSPIDDNLVKNNDFSLKEYNTKLCKELFKILKCIDLNKLINKCRSLDSIEPKLIYLNYNEFFKSNEYSDYIDYKINSCLEHALKTPTVFITKTYIKSLEKQIILLKTKLYTDKINKHQLVYEKQLCKLNTKINSIDPNYRFISMDLCETKENKDICDLITRISVYCDFCNCITTHDSINFSSCYFCKLLKKTPIYNDYKLENINLNNSLKLTETNCKLHKIDFDFNENSLFNKYIEYSKIKYKPNIPLKSIDFKSLLKYMKKDGFITINGVKYSENCFFHPVFYDSEKFVSKIIIYKTNEHKILYELIDPINVKIYCDKCNNSFVSNLNKPIICKCSKILAVFN